MLEISLRDKIICSISGIMWSPKGYCRIHVAGQDSQKNILVWPLFSTRCYFFFSLIFFPKMFDIIFQTGTMDTFLFTNTGSGGGFEICCQRFRSLHVLDLSFFMLHKTFPWSLWEKQHATIPHSVQEWLPSSVCSSWLLFIPWHGGIKLSFS